MNPESMAAAVGGGGGRYFPLCGPLLRSDTGEQKRKKERKDSYWLRDYVV